MKLSEYNGSHVVLDDEIVCVETLQDRLDEDDLSADADVFTVDDEPIWGEILTAQNVWMMISDFFYDEITGEPPWDNGKETAKTALVDALNAWAAKHLTGTVLVGTRTKLDIPELFEVKS